MDQGATFVLCRLVPVKTVSPNRTSGEHWSKRRKRAESHRKAVWAIFRSTQPHLPCRVRLERLAPSGGLDGHDNLRMSCKHVADGIADWLGLADDSDPRVSWEYGQRRAKDYGVIVTVMWDAQ